MKPTGATKEAMSHSPLPWRWLPDEGQFIVDAKGNIVAEVPCQGCNPIDGEFLVTAVNERERLREALRQVRAASNHRSLEMVGSLVIGLIPLIDAALNEVEG